MAMTTAHTPIMYPNHIIPLCLVVIRHVDHLIATLSIISIHIGSGHRRHSSPPLISRHTTTKTETPHIAKSKKRVTPFRGEQQPKPPTDKSQFYLSQDFGRRELVQKTYREVKRLPWPYSRYIMYNKCVCCTFS